MRVTVNTSLCAFAVAALAAASASGVTAFEPTAVSTAYTASVHTAQHPTAGSVTQDQAGFQPVRQTARPAVAMHSPAPGELWIVERGADNQSTVLEHLSNGVWTQSTLPARAGEQISSGGGRVAIIAGDRLFTTTGGDTWTEVSVPGDSPMAVAVGPDGTMFVNVWRSSSTTGTGRATYTVYSMRDGKWTDLGGPTLADERDWAYARELRVVDGVLIGRWVGGSSPTKFETVQRHTTGTTWAHQFTIGVSGKMLGTTAGGWITESADSQLILGTSSFRTLLKPLCREWRAPNASDCTTETAVAAAAPRADGRIVIAAIDDGGYRLRAQDGTETPLSGQVGTKPILASEPGTNTTWALNTTGDTSTLQRNDG